MRALWAASRFLMLQQMRGPLLLLSGLLFCVTAGTLPVLGAPASAERTRSLASLYAGAGAIVLFALALILPLPSVSLRRGFPPGGLGRQGWQAAAGLGHALILTVAALLCAVLALGLITLQVGWPDRRAAPTSLREVWRRAPADPLLLASGHRSPPILLEASNPLSPASRLPGTTLDVVLRLAPRTRIDPRQEAVPGGALRTSVSLSWRDRSSHRWNREILSFHRGRPREVPLELVATGDRLGLELRFEDPTPGRVLVFEPDSILLLGPRGSFFAAFFRSFLLLGLGAISMMGLCLWLSSFVSYAVAVLGALTAALASAVLSPWIPGVPLTDPGGLLAAGLAVSWSDLGPTALKAGIVLLAATLLAFRARAPAGAEG